MLTAKYRRVKPGLHVARSLNNSKLTFWNFNFFDKNLDVENNLLYQLEKISNRSSMYFGLHENAKIDI
jgi:hypothetical protein